MALPAGTVTSTRVLAGEPLDHAVVRMFRKGKKRHSSSSSQSSEISTKSKVRGRGGGGERKGVFGRECPRR